MFKQQLKNSTESKNRVKLSRVHQAPNLAQPARPGARARLYRGRGPRSCRRLAWPYSRRPSVVSWACALTGTVVSWPASRQCPAAYTPWSQYTLLYCDTIPGCQPLLVTIQSILLQYNTLFFNASWSQYNPCIVTQYPCQGSPIAIQCPPIAIQFF